VDRTEIDVPPGLYHALITGRGFVSHGWPGSTEPGDEWRIRLWPSPTPPEPRRLCAFTETATDVDDRDDVVADSIGYVAAAREQRKERALQAGSRIKADLDRAATARQLSGDLSQAVIDVVVPGMTARYWFLAANLDVTSMSGQGDPMVGDWFTMHSSSSRRDDRDPITGTNGQIRCQWTELEDPQRVSMSWQWLGPEGWDFVTGEQMYERMKSGTLPRQVPRLAQPTSLTILFRDATEQPTANATSIHLVHGNVPVEWTTDLVDFWASKIDIWVGQAAQSDKQWRMHGR
jgi:hypothetical protein